MEKFIGKAEFMNLDRGEQFRLLEGWRKNYTDKIIYQEMGMGAHAYYKIVKELGCSPKDTSPKKYKNASASKVALDVMEATRAQQSISLALEKIVTKEQAEDMFHNIVDFLGTGEYKVKMEITI